MIIRRIAFQNNLMDRMAPRVLFDAFYFKSEPLDGKLLGDVNWIRTALGQFLHEDQWMEAESVVASMRDSLGKKLASLSAANGEPTRKMKELEQNQMKLEAQQAALDQEELSLRDAESRQAEETENLAKPGDEDGLPGEIKNRFLRAQIRMDVALPEVQIR